ncbi:hypothetical protein FHG87_019818, partial [Trinorchestia longiramus]
DLPQENVVKYQESTNSSEEATNLTLKATNSIGEGISGVPANEAVRNTSCTAPGFSENENYRFQLREMSSSDHESPEGEAGRPSDQQFQEDYQVNDTDDTSPELLDSPLLKSYKFLKLKCDSFPKPKGAIKTTLSNASYSFAQSQISKHAENLSSSVPNLTLARVPYKSSKKSFRKLEETTDPSPDEDVNQVSVKVDTDTDGFAKFDRKIIKSLDTED